MVPNHKREKKNTPKQHPRSRHRPPSRRSHQTKLTPKGPRR